MTVSVLHNFGLRQLCAIAAKLCAATSFCKRALCQQNKTANPKKESVLQFCEKTVLPLSRMGTAFAERSPAAKYTLNLYVCVCVRACTFVYGCRHMEKEKDREEKLGL